MNRGFLKWFYIGVQFIMLAVSIPKVATLFHAYDRETMGPLIGGIDMRSWLVGIAIDLTATFTTWAAMAKYDESRKRTSLLAPGLIILFCTVLSVVANYEDAATQNPVQYAGINLFAHPALLINPLLISAPPVLVLLLILLVPSVLARARIKTAAEIEAETAQEMALIEAGARLRETKARANAKVRSAQLSGLVDTVGAVTKRTGLTQSSAPESAESGAIEARNANDGAVEYGAFDPAQSGFIPGPSANVSRAMWNTMSIKDRVLKSGVISTQEVAEVLALSATRARELVKEVRASGDEQPAVPGRTGVPYQALIDALYERKTKESFAQAKALEKALGLRKRTRQLHVVATPDDTANDEESIG